MSHMIIGQEKTETPLDELDRWFLALGELENWLDDLIQRIENDFPTKSEIITEVTTNEPHQ